MSAFIYNRESDTKTIQIWDVEARALASVVESGDHYHILLSSKGLLLTRMIAELRETEFFRLDIQGRQTAHFLVAGSSEIASLSFSPDGRSVASLLQRDMAHGLRHPHLGHFNREGEGAYQNLFWTRPRFRRTGGPSQGSVTAIRSAYGTRKRGGRSWN